MSRFDDLLPSLSQEPAYKDNVVEFPPTDALRWEVVPSDGTPPYEFSLAEFARGNPDRGVRQREALIRQMAPAIRVKSQGRPVTFKYATRMDLVKLWQFLDHLAGATRGDINDLTQIDNSHGALLKAWLLRSANVNVSVASGYLSRIKHWLTLARNIEGISKAELLWPTIRLSRGTRHHEVDRLALEQLYRHVKGLHRGFRAAAIEGRSLIEQEKLDGEVLLDSPSDARSPQKIATLALSFVEASLERPELRFSDHASWTFYYQDCIAAPAYIPLEVRTPIDAVRWFVPTLEDAMAAFLLVLLHTGWNPDTAFGIDVSDDGAWFDDRIDAKSSDDKTATVAIYGMKGKTGREQIAFSLKRPWSHPFQVIAYMIERTAPLRASAQKTLKMLESLDQPSLTERRQIANIQEMIKSPWIYYAESGPFDENGGGRVCMLQARRTHPIFKSIRMSAIANISVEKTAEVRDRIELGLSGLRLSDARDGFAARIYENSLYNVLLVKHALGHGSIQATKNYLRQRSQMLERFSRFTSFQTVFFDEIKNHRAVDPTIMFIRLAVGDVTAEQRERLGDHRMRTRMNMGCLNPADPPRHFAKPGASDLCRVQRCTLCRHGVVFDDSFPAIAARQAELSYIRSRSSSDNFDRSSFSIEWAAIRVLIDQVFVEEREEIEAATDIHLQKLRDGTAYLFDQMPTDINWDT